MAAAAHFSRNRLYRPVLAKIGCIGMFWWPFQPYRFSFPLELARFGPNQRESGRVGANRHESKKKKKKKERESRRVGRWTLDAALGHVGL